MRARVQQHCHQHQAGVEARGGFVGRQVAAEGAAAALAQAGQHLAPDQGRAAGQARLGERRGDGVQGERPVVGVHHGGDGRVGGVGELRDGGARQLGGVRELLAREDGIDGPGGCDGGGGGDSTMPGAPPARAATGCARAPSSPISAASKPGVASKTRWRSAFATFALVFAFAFAAAASASSAVSAAPRGLAVI